MASSLAIYYTPMHFMWGVKSGATPACPAEMLLTLWLKTWRLPVLTGSD